MSQRLLADTEGFVLTAGNKVELIQRLTVAIKQREVSWPAGRRSQTEREYLAQRRGGAEGENSITEYTENTEGRLPAANCSLPTGPWETLTNELKRYEYAIGPTGRVAYGAPSGYHDDCVIALALANHGRWKGDRVGTLARMRCGL